MKRSIFAILAILASQAAAQDVGYFTRLTGDDLAVQTYKWIGRTIETKAFCFYADRDEFRCMAGPRARIDFTKLYPYEAQTYIQNKCDTINKAFSKMCLVTLRFTYEKFDEMDSGGMSGKTTIVIAKDNKGTIVAR
jgi:hypothetical protein